MKSRREPDVIIIENDSEVQSSTISNSNSWVYTENASLNTDSNVLIEGGEMLDDRIIEAAQNILNAQFPELMAFSLLYEDNLTFHLLRCLKIWYKHFLRAIHIVGTGCLLDFILLSFLSFLTRIGSVHIIFIFFFSKKMNACFLKIPRKVFFVPLGLPILVFTAELFTG